MHATRMNVPPEVLIPTYDRENLLFESGPLGEHAPIAGTDHEIAERHERAVTTPIGLPLFHCGMPGVAIEFDDEAVTDQDVNTADAFDRNLDAQPYAK